MSKLTFTPLTKLRPYKNNRQVQVKCLHSWQQKNTFWRITKSMLLEFELSCTEFNMICLQENGELLKTFP
ncbi:unnamed protein product [Brassica napus]|uniref:(rape) hypothetical protein n=1 Tax=Brassica napus TaxID=3708 RepID=A0A816VB83_BRANA|nr:unnamed protein product [Brassica napus]